MCAASIQADIDRQTDRQTYPLIVLSSTVLNLWLRWPGRQTDPLLIPLMGWLQLRFDFGSTGVRHRFDNCRPSTRPTVWSVAADAEDSFVRPLLFKTEPFYIHITATSCL